MINSDFLYVKGFKKGCSTVDAIFSLHTLIEHFLNNNKRLYVGFIDYL